MAAESLITFLVPFIFVFAIVFGALEFTEMFKKNKRVAGLIALCLAFFAISSEQVVGYIYQFLPIASIGFIIVFFFGFILAPFKEGGKEGKKDFSFLLIVIAFIFLLITSYGYEAFMDYFPSLAFQSENFMYLGGLIIIVMMFYAAYKRGSGRPEK